MPRGRIELHGLKGRWGRFQLGPIDLAVEPGEYVVVLGRSGCGKTSLLETICGLRSAAGGHVLIDGRDVTHLDPADRRIGFVPQDYALFPTMSVANNLTYALRVEGLPRAARNETAGHLATMLGIDHLLERGVAKLSGGEKQRVALGRAIAAQPALLLLDEPVSALDETARQQVCAELASLQQRMHITVLHVCHNLEEMWSVAHRVAIMDEGRMHQFGPPAELCAAPATAAVARSLRLGTILPVEHVNGQAHCRLGDCRVVWPAAPRQAAAALLRPECVSVEQADQPTTDTSAFSVPAVTLAVLPSRNGRIVRVDAGEIVDVAGGDITPARGEKVWIHFSTDSLEPLGVSSTRPSH